MTTSPSVRRAWLTGSAAALLLALVSGSARADITKAQCVKANADAQVLRMSGKLAEARAQFESCVDSACPALVRSDCAQRLDELDRAQPSIVFDVKDATGADVSAVNVTIDGKPVAGKTAGTALRVDPGYYTFTFTAPGQPPITRQFVLKEGDKDRRERIVFGATATPAPAAAGSPEPTPGPDASQTPASLEAGAPGAGSSGAMSTQKILGLVAGGIGLAGVAVGSIFGLQTLSAVSQQKSDCQSGTSCSNHAQALSDHSTAATDGTISTIGFAAGGALLAAGALLFFTAPHATESQSTGLVVLPSVAPGGGALWLHTEF